MKKFIVDYFISFNKICIILTILVLLNVSYGFLPVLGIGLSKIIIAILLLVLSMRIVNLIKVIGILNSMIFKYLLYRNNVYGIKHPYYTQQQLSDTLNDIDINITEVNKLLISPNILTIYLHKIQIFYRSKYDKEKYLNKIERLNR